MSVCRFYLQGNCRYGDRCYNEHPNGNASGRRQQKWEDDDYGGQLSWQGDNRSGGYHQSPLARSYNKPNDNSSDNQYNSPAGRSDGGYKQDKYHWSKDNRYAALEQEEKPNTDVNLMLSTIQSDIKVWAESKMWPFSCYSCTKGAGCIEGLPDISPEELRVLASLHPSEYLNIVSEIESTYVRTKDELFEMSDATKSNLISQLNVIDNNPSQNLKISSLYGPKFNFSKNDPEIKSETPVVPQPSFSFKIDDQGGNLSHGVGFGIATGSPATISIPESITSENSQNISVFGSSTTSKSKSVSAESEVYTNHESLSADEKKKFEAERFTIGEIPNRPPAEHYCR